MSGHHQDDDTLIRHALDELDSPERTDVEAHVGACPACAETVRKLRGAIDGFRRAPLPDPPAHVLLQLLSAQAGMRTPSHLRVWWRRPLGLAVATGAAAVIFLGGYWMGHRSGGATPLQTETSAPRPPATASARLPQIAFQTLPPLEGSGANVAAPTSWTAPRREERDSL